MNNQGLERRKHLKEETYKSLIEEITLKCGTSRVTLLPLAVSATGIIDLQSQCAMQRVLGLTKREVSKLLSACVKEAIKGSKVMWDQYRKEFYK